METHNEAGARAASVEFSGNTGEYFRIWIVNTALTVVTLGIYSAWAKVRKRRYFYTHTRIEDGHFDYHARPVGILIGRVIAVAMAGAYLASSYVSPFAPLVVMAIILLLVPWLVVRSRIFNLRNTSLHGLRFDFLKDYAGAAKAYYGGVLLAIVTLGVGTPTALYWRNRFAVDNSGYGTSRFTLFGESGPFYRIVWKTVGLTLLGMIPAFFLNYLIMDAAVTALDIRAEDGQVPPQWLVLASSLPVLLVYLVSGVYYNVRLKNHVWNSSVLGRNRFLSTLSVRKMTAIYLTNLVAIVVSLGLLIPWAQIRLARYRASALQLELVDDWQQFRAAARDAGSALGEEIGEAFDVGVDFAL